jgi:TonB family protein
MNAPSNLREALESALGSEYEILGELGRGGTSVVFHARDLLLGREVAIKVIRDSQLDDPEAINRFRREAQMLGVLQHPNIVLLYGARALPGGSIALVMQHGTWRTLKAHIREQGPLSPAATEQVLMDLLRATSYLHANGVVHRDIKPENIFIELPGGKALLSDFGIARWTDRSSNVTLTGVVIGTPAYMAPELIDGEPATPASDLYSLGMVAYEMLTGKRPWDGESLYGVIYKQKNERLPEVETFRNDVPERLRAAIRSAIEKNPAARWRDAQALLQQLGAQPGRQASEVLRLPISIYAASIDRTEDAPTVGVELARLRALIGKPEPSLPLPPPDGATPEPTAGTSPTAVDSPERLAAIGASLAGIGAAAGAAVTRWGRERPPRRYVQVGVVAAVIIGVAALQLVASSESGTPVAALQTAAVAEQISLPRPAASAIAEPVGEPAPAPAEPAEPAEPALDSPPESAPARSERPAAPVAAAPRQSAAQRTATRQPSPTPPPPQPAPQPAPPADSPLLGSPAPAGSPISPESPPSIAAAAPSAPPAPRPDPSTTVGGAPSAPTIPGAIRQPELQNRPEVLRELARLYAGTSAAANNRTRPGRTVVAVRIDRNGVVVGSEISETSGSRELDQLALRAARAMRFSIAPGTPNDVWLRVPLVFQ